MSDVDNNIKLISVTKNSSTLYPLSLFQAMNFMPSRWKSPINKIFIFINYLNKTKYFL